MFKSHVVKSQPIKSRFNRFSFLANFALCLSLGGTLACGGGEGSSDGGREPEVFTGELGTVLFVTQTPIGGLGSVVGTFDNHEGRIEAANRGGDLMIRYPDGELRNLTREAGFGDAGEEQGANAIAVREPSVHWSGNRALFSMVVGAPQERYDRGIDFFWQIYEVEGLAKGEEVSITKVPGQPQNFNNVSPIYGSDDAILFVSDRPREGEEHHYPTLDEYESMPSTVGIYRLEPDRESFQLIEHSPSGVFSLSLDTHGRVLFTKWDHLQRDQQGDTESVVSSFQPITHADESADSTTTSSIEGQEFFPEARNENDSSYDDSLSPHRFNHFFAWQINQDGTEEETVNHVGRHEWGGSYTEGSFLDDQNLTYRAPNLVRANVFDLPGDGGTFHIRQDKVEPSWYLTTVAQEFSTASSGWIARLEGDPSVNPEDMRVVPLTPHPDEAVVPDDVGYFRNPLRLSDGSYVAAHTPADGPIDNEGSLTEPNWNYDFRLKVLEPEGERFVAGPALTAGIERTLTWWTPDERAEWSGNLWELDPVEVAPQKAPPMKTGEIPEVERGVFSDEDVDLDELREWLAERDLALVVSRDVTARDRNDVQQPYYLTVPGGVSSAGEEDGYDISHMQFVQGDYVRSYGRREGGRRVLARAMHGQDLFTSETGPAGSVELASDGSMAAIVPARRALSWQLVDPQGEGVVRERNWVSFGRGEIRVCASCHGVNKETHNGLGEPQNPPQALRDLLQEWKATR